VGAHALFAGLVVDPHGNPVETGRIADQAQYVVVDRGMKFHLDAEGIDRKVLAAMGSQALDNREAITEGVLKMIGQDDLFTKAAVDAQLNNMDRNFDQLIATGLPENARVYLGLLGFRVVIDFHGDILRIDQPSGTEEEE
jgi:hypothetical protein